MSFQFPKPIVPGGLITVMSGGACPGKQAIVRTAFWTAQTVAEHSGVPIQPYGAREAFARILDGDPNAITLLTPENLKPASHLEPPVVSFGTRGPDAKMENWIAIVEALLSRDIRYVLQWGGDYSTVATLGFQDAIDHVVKKRGGDDLKHRIYFGCILKTIDRDIRGLHDHEDTIGFSTASERLGNMLEMMAWDAHHSDNFIHLRVVQGKEVGHLCDRAARLAGIGAYLVPEFFETKVRLGVLADIIIGVFLKGIQVGRRHMCMPVAEGCINILQPDSDTPGLEAVREAHQKRAHMACEVALGQKDWDFLGYLTKAVETRLKGITLPNGISIKLRSGTDGYSARGARPNATDESMAKLHTRKAIYHMLRGNSAFVVAGTELEVRHVPLVEFFGTSDPNEIRPQRLNIHSDAVAEHWTRMRNIRLLPSDLENGQADILAKQVSLNPAEFRKRFQPVAEWGARQF